VHRGIRRVPQVDLARARARVSARIRVRARARARFRFRFRARVKVRMGGTSSARATPSTLPSLQSSRLR